MFQHEFNTDFYLILLFNSLKNFGRFFVIKVSFLIPFHILNIKPSLQTIVCFPITLDMHDTLTFILRSFDLEDCENSH